jgi:hypothetical protein
MKPPDFTIAVEKGYLSCTRASRRLRDVWSHYCDAFHYPMIELILDRGTWTVEYDMILTQPGEASAEEIWAVASLVDSLGCEKYVLQPRLGHIGPVPFFRDAEVIVEAAVVILAIATRRWRYRESKGWKYKDMFRDDDLDRAEEHPKC